MRNLLPIIRTNAKIMLKRRCNVVLYFSKIDQECRLELRGFKTRFIQIEKKFLMVL